LTTSDEIAERLVVLKQVEQALIESPDTELRFHSGVPAIAEAA
jgi:tRNA isopentenyl-2-thiomethyl-A-37 hydroxylase MiaE